VALPELPFEVKYAGDAGSGGGLVGEVESCAPDDSRIQISGHSGPAEHLAYEKRQR